MDFDTTRPTYATRPDRCHISHVVADTDTWEQKMAQVLEDMDEVVCYVKNQNLGFTIPSTLDGQERQYVPDFIARIRAPGADSPRRPQVEPEGRHGDTETEGEGWVNLLIEVSGEKKKD